MESYQTGPFSLDQKQMKKKREEEWCCVEKMVKGGKRKKKKNKSERKVRSDVCAKEKKNQKRLEGIV
jgi:hypothetical protein